jgi:tRNA threonylcarbamoyladenosine biosynthesis protein TsaE
LGSPDKVASPTFTIGKVYETDKFEVHHFDFYRLQDAGLAVYELQDLLGDPGIVIVMEWAQVVSHVLPKERLSITFTRTGDDSRTLTLAYPESMTYLVEDL